MTYTKILDHETESINNLIFEFKKTTIQDLIKINGENFQELENAISDIYDSQFIDRATGISLDLIGNETGQLRPVTGDITDNTYRYLIKAKIAANRSNGTLPEIYNILGLLGAIGIKAQDIPHATLKLNLKGNLLLPLIDILKTLIGATAPISLEINKYTDTPFGFDGDTDSYGFGIGELGDTINNELT